MQKSWFHPLISLIDAIGLLALSIRLDDFLILRRRMAAASFDNGPFFLAEIVEGFLLFIGWAALGWHVLFSQRLGRGTSILS